MHGQRPRRAILLDRLTRKTYPVNMSWSTRLEDAMRMMSIEGIDEAPADPKARKRRRVLEAATELFTRHGYKRTSVDDVARAAGVSKGAVYLYFDGKADLLIHAAAFEKLKSRARLLPILDPDLTPDARLRLYLETAFEMVEDMPLVSRLTSGEGEMHHVMQDMSAEMRHAIESAQRGFLRDLMAPFAEKHGWSPADLDDRVEVLLSVMMNTASLIEQPGRLAGERYARVIADMLIEGIG